MATIKFKKLSAAFVTVALLGLGVASPANAEANENDPAEPVSSLRISEDTSAVLEGPGGSFGIRQGQAQASRQSTSRERVDFKNDGGELILTSQVSGPDDSGVVYMLDISKSASVEVVDHGSGENSIVLLNEEGGLLGGLASVEARDARGNLVSTSYEVDGSTVTQRVASAPEIQYPVRITATAGTVWYSSAWVTSNSKGYIVNADPTKLGRQQIAYNVHYIHVAHLKSILGTQAYKVNSNIESQFLCHVVGAWFPTGVYNMESWQPETALGILILPWVRCNMIK